MKDHMISMFIDDEMNIDEKINFVTTIHADAAVKDDTIGLLQQEMLIRDRVVDRIREARFDARPKLDLRFWKPAAAFACGLAAALIGPQLVKRGLLFVGLDVIGDYLTEINVTSPNCIREVDNIYQLNISSELFDVIEAQLAS